MTRRSARKNKFSFNIFERVSVTLMFFLVVLTWSVANLHALTWMTSDWLTGAVLPAVIVDLTNEERVTGNVGNLMRNPLLDEAARLKAEDMVKNGYFAHYSPEGVSPWYWLTEVGYAFSDAGENLAVRFSDSDTVVDAWMESPLHRENIMDKRYAETGVGTAVGDYHGVPSVYVVQFFATPGSRPPADTQELSIALVPTGSDEDGTVLPMAYGSRNVANALHLNFNNGVGGYQGNSNVLAVTTPESNLFERSLVSPRTFIDIVYALAALVAITSLVTSIFIEWQKHHVRHIAYGSLLITTMGVLVYVHILLTSGVSIV